MSLRALIVYRLALLIIRLGGGKRFLGKHAAFDVVLGIIFGSVLSRAVNGSSPFFATLGAGFIIASLHWLFATIALYSQPFGILIKGTAQPLIKEGQIQWDTLHQGYISKEDLIEALRAHGKLSDPSQVQAAHLERSGEISVIP